MKEIIYVPILHSSLAPAGLPEDVLFVCPGLAIKDAPGRAFEPSGLPFKGREAKAVLDEMLALGLSLGQGGELKLLAGQGLLEREAARANNLRAENAALQEFARSGQALKVKTVADAEPDAPLRSAQKTLLLAWEHEECLLSVRELEATVLRGQKRLQAALGEGPENERSDALSQVRPPIRPDYSWRVVLEALAAFLPQGARLFTAFGPMLEDLSALGLLEPLPAQAASALPAWPQELTSSLLGASLPLWRLLGYAAPPQDRPWLGATHELLAAPRLEP